MPAVTVHTLSTCALQRHTDWPLWMAGCTASLLAASKPAEQPADRKAEPLAHKRVDRLVHTPVDQRADGKVGLLAHKRVDLPEHKPVGQPDYNGEQVLADMRVGFLDTVMAGPLLDVSQAVSGQGAVFGAVLPRHWDAFLSAVPDS